VFPEGLLDAVGLAVALVLVFLVFVDLAFVDLARRVDVVRRRPVVLAELGGVEPAQDLS